MRTIAIALAWALACSTQPVLAGNAGILFAVREDPRPSSAQDLGADVVPVLVDPIAYIVDGKVKSLGEDWANEEFAQKYYAADRRFQAYGAGVVTGSLQFRPLDDWSYCESTPGLVNQLHGAVKMAKLASNITFTASRYTMRPLSRGETAEINDLARAIYSSNGVPASLTIDTIGTAAIERGADIVVVVSLRAYYPTEEKGYPGVHAAFIIAERDKNGRLKPVHTWFHSGEEAGAETQDLVDMLDIDGDGYPELVTVIGYYETADNVIYRKTPTGWETAFQETSQNCF